MNFINNWSQALTLGDSAATCALNLPDGVYRLTIADSATQAAAWEIVEATVSGGTANLVRGLEETSVREWGAGSVIYCALTAGLLMDLFTLAGKISSLQQILSELDSRVAKLEGGMSITSVQQDFSTYGFSKDTDSSDGVFGSINPEFASAIPGADASSGAPGEILQLLWDGSSIRVLLRGNYQSASSLPFQKLAVNGKEFNFSSASVYQSSSQFSIKLSVSDNPFPPGNVKISFS